MAKRIDVSEIVGTKIGKLFIKSYFRAGKLVKYNCVCECGNETIVSRPNLRSGHTRSCGCLVGIKGRERGIDLTGKRFGKFLVIEKDPNQRDYAGAYWLCKCDCGREVSVFGGSLRQRKSISCGCSLIGRTPTNFINLEGKTFGRLTVIKRTKNIELRNRSIVCWECKCICGKSINVSTESLNSGNTRSCGCLNQSWEATKVKEYFMEKHGAKQEYKIVKNPITNQYLRYDIYIPKHKLFIEINGIQHYERNDLHKLLAKNKKTSVKKIVNDEKFRYELKKEFAIKNGIFLEIDLRNYSDYKEIIKYINKFIRNINEKVK